MRDFKELLIWKEGHHLALDCYQLTRSFPPEEKYGITSQLRRSCTSIPTNIAEGCGRDSNAEMKRFLIIANGSCSELQYLLILSHDLGYILTHIFKELDERVQNLKKMIYRFTRNIPQTFPTPEH